MKKQISQRKQTLRNTNIEWLRIISMILIIAFHTRVPITDQPLYIRSYVVAFSSWGLLGVDLFLIISAWFLSAQQFRIKKVIHIVFQTFTWVFLYIIVYFVYKLGFENWDLKSTVTCFGVNGIDGFFQPFYSKYYWFITSYFFMLLMSPFFKPSTKQMQSKDNIKITDSFYLCPHLCTILIRYSRRCLLFFVCLFVDRIHKNLRKFAYTKICKAKVLYPFDYCGYIFKIRSSVFGR